MAVYANQEALEGTVSSPTVLTLTRKSRTLEIINDSGVRNLQYKFRASESYATLKPFEVVSMYAHVREIHLNAEASVDYRIRVLG